MAPEDCDTVLAQIAAEVLECEYDDITVFGADTDVSPYDSGSYASSTTYLTGKAVEICAQNLRKKICTLGAQLLECGEDEVAFDGKLVSRLQPVADGKNSISLADIATASMCGNSVALEETVTKSSPVSPPPYMVGVAGGEGELLAGALLSLTQLWTAVPLSILIWQECRPRAASCRASVWR